MKKIAGSQPKMIEYSPKMKVKLTYIKPLPIKGLEEESDSSEDGDLQ